MPPIAPVVAVTSVNLRAQIAATFAPRFADVTQREIVAVASLNSQLANRGLAESGVAVGEQSLLQASFQRERTVLAGEQARAEVEAEQEVLLLNATNAQQARLAQAQITAQVQQQNAANILQGNLAQAQAYLDALNINAQQASAYRTALLGFLSEQQRTNAAQSAAQLDFLATIYAATLRSADVAATIEADIANQTANRQAQLLQLQQTLAAEATRAQLAAEAARPAPSTFGPRAPFAITPRGPGLGGERIPPTTFAPPRTLASVFGPLQQQTSPFGPRSSTTPLSIPPPRSRSGGFGIFR